MALTDIFDSVADKRYVIIFYLKQMWEILIHIPEEQLDLLKKFNLK